MKREKFARIYNNLYFNHPQNFKLMQNSANALLLQFKEPLIYDLTIPNFPNIKTLMHILIEDLQGNKINPSDVDCLTCTDYSDIIKFDSCNLFSNKVKKGLEFCFNRQEKYDIPPLEVHLASQDIFGSEWVFGYGNLYRFRDGKKEEIQKQVEEYFDKMELEAFKKIGEFIMPYASRVHLPHKCAV
jgi:hypothetical protein